MLFLFKLGRSEADDWGEAYGNSLLETIDVINGLHSSFYKLNLNKSWIDRPQKFGSDNLQVHLNDNSTKISIGSS